MSENPRHVVAIGGGGFSQEPDNLQLEEYVLSLTGKSKPKVCFLPTAGGDSEPAIRRFHWLFRKLARGGQSHLRLIESISKDPAVHLAKQDVIFVGGGDTLNMLRVWADTGVDRLLRAAYERGAVLAGISAGAHCWFGGGLADAPGTFSPFVGLGLLPGSMSVHYDSEVARRPLYQKQIASGGLPAGHGVDDGAALHYVNEQLHAIVSSRPDARAYRVESRNGAVHEAEIKPQYLGGRGTVLRRASALDIPGIIQAHHDSVTMLCAKDYSPDQIQAWAAKHKRPDASVKWVDKIASEQVWVAELEGRIEGFAHMRAPLDLAPSAYLNGMYLTPNGSGKGLGRRLMNLVELEARRRGHPRLETHATKTAIGFYAVLGYQPTGRIFKVQMSDQAIESQPMAKDLPPL